MNPISLHTVATGLSVVGVVLTIPSSVVLMLWAINAVRQFVGLEAPAKTNFGGNPDAILLMLKGIREIVGALESFTESVGQFIFNGLSLLALLGLVVGAACWVTGRGLQSNAHWARVAAFILITLTLLPSLLIALSLHNGGRLLMFGFVTVLALGLHALWMGSVRQTL